MSNEELKVWAKREINLATDDFYPKDVTDSCYHTALATYIDFLDRALIMNDDLVEITKAILYSLMNTMPLTPIQEDEEYWVINDNTLDYDAGGCEDGPTWNMYQSLRYPSLFKKVVYKGGDEKEITYMDIHRSHALDIWSLKYYEGGLAETILNEMLPIKMPYQPSKEKIRIYTEEFNTSGEGENSDTFGILYFRRPNGELEKVDRFFKEDLETGKIIEINYQEYQERTKGARLARTKHEENTHE